MPTVLTSTPQAPEPSALTTLLTSTSSSSNPLSATAIQVLHNLQHQHLWTSLQIHDLQISNSSVSPSSTSTSTDKLSSSPSYLISGIPPHRIYTHPDEQLFMLERGLREDDIELERMFVIPTAHGQSWSLRKMAAVFDALPEDEDESNAQSLDDAKASGNNAEKAAKLTEYYEYRRKARVTKEWGGKRLLLAMVDRSMGGDGTMVYYVVQEGAVKPRQN
ncbi:hypothetical protein KXW98_001337 [Aspergillus fumigatus]|uniref:tRNA-splicing endonuclease subunit Sen15 domain-containing protein n=3 Tax=Aspergillus fumigatus TaxID=746128 RepID=Q4WJM8_ASPFU|nr:conserved hypothetical protein [Aspergillus fumigatus Af293]EDP55878.1 conserved hypothetical protein [Aspergillus fumigatus A1163]KAF4263157.1 hypothetical protein CNMCM8714_008589 [Aspergillus fumigatus]KMK57216.1 hypothetical protein Y699_06757 [Aspergillus fumigatus Z5]EAL88254.1 conserved hypothetical protein [Aspergillus fumigatus Af293]KAF4265584.1 hypothetical protein CNMCM8057_000433 [Aspergillus fumigatus]